METRCVKTTRNSKNFWNQTLLQCWFLKEHWERTILNYTWWWCTWQYEGDHVEGILYFEVWTHPTSEGGSVEARRSAHSWKWKSAIIKDVTVWQSWSNPYFVTEQFLGFVSWTESTNTWPKRQEKFLLQVFRTELQGNLSRRLNHDQSRL